MGIARRDSLALRMIGSRLPPPRSKVLLIAGRARCRSISDRWINMPGFARLTFMTIASAGVVRTTNPAPCGDTLPDRCDPGSLWASRGCVSEGP